MSVALRKSIFSGSLGGLCFMDEKFNAEKPIKAIWCVDSETSDEFLIDLNTGAVIARRGNDGKWINPEASNSSSNSDH